MNTNQVVTANRERTVHVQYGGAMLVFLLALLLVDVALIVFAIKDGVETVGHPHVAMFVLGIFGLPVLIIMLTGLFTLQPNEARVLVLFGKYKGTVRESGFHWGNPFYSNGPQAASWRAQLVAAKTGTTTDAGQKPLSRNKISLRARTLNGERLKVNDKVGNPIEIAAVIVWRVGDTAQAVFDVDDYEKYVGMQSESALRHLANLYAYDHGEEAEGVKRESTLRSNVEEVSQALRA